MDSLHHLWATFPDWGKQLTVVSILGALAWFFKWAIPAIGRAFSKYIKKRHEEKVVLRSRRVWKYIQQESTGATSVFRLASIISHFKFSERDAKEALRLLQTKGLLTASYDELMWYSDAKARFFN